MSRHPRVDHAKAAAALREQPGIWLPVGEYRNSLTVAGMARLIRTSTGGSTHFTARFYAPAGAFESRTRLTKDGTLLEARYVGDGRSKRSDRIRQSPDTERVLGQIDRGEVRCGADAAREIAARHQEAYGDTVWAADQDAAWADALTAVTGGNVR
ncbi:hypothetical protein ACH419_39520 [Streptomyces bobili]|uniref:hypothetical protein n=1 Tax=Streptomyces bobili TaxID=67280 RepID=UPI003790FB3D